MEIFGYIFIGIIVLYILGFIVNLFSNDKTITIEELSNNVTEWFIKMYPLRKKFPRIVISDESSDFAGTFTFYNNTITLFTQNVSNYESIVEITNHSLENLSYTKTYSDGVQYYNYKTSGTSLSLDIIWADGETASFNYISTNLTVNDICN